MRPTRLSRFALFCFADVLSIVDHPFHYPTHRCNTLFSISIKYTDKNPSCQIPDRSSRAIEKSFCTAFGGREGREVERGHPAPRPGLPPLHPAFNLEPCCQRDNSATRALSTHRTPDI